jgi:hypothetical protein
MTRHRPGAAALAAVLVWIEPAAGWARPSPPSAPASAAEVAELRRRIESLEALIRALEAKIAPPAGPPGPGAPGDDVETLRREVESLKVLLRTLEARTASPAPPAPQGPPEPRPLPILRTQGAYMNVSVVALFDAGTSSTPEVSELLNLGDHDPSGRGAALPNTEAVFEGAVDPYFKGLVDIVWKLDEEGETGIEMEESYLTTTALPGHVAVRAGQWFAEFGRHNPRHPHQWDFVGQPLVFNRMFGPDGLRNPGIQVSWLAPAPFFLEAGIALLNGRGGTAWSFRSPESAEFHGRTVIDRDLHTLGDLVYVPRLAASFDLGPSSTLLLGSTAALGPNSAGADTRTGIHGVDVYWKWRPERAARGFPFVSLQVEGMARRYEAAADPAAGLPAETLRDRGFYAQLLWGCRPRWVLGLRGEAVDGDRGAFSGEGPWRAGRTRLSANLTWHLSEYSKLRFQYDRDTGPVVGDQNSLWVQMEVLLGSHGAHRF